MRSSMIAAIAAVTVTWSASARAQAPAATTSDSLLGCGARMATAAGFRAIPRNQAGRIGMMRPRDTGGPTYPLDGMRLLVTPPDPRGMVHLQVSTTTFVISRQTGVNQDEIPVAPTLKALADSIRVTCQPVHRP